MLNCSRRHSNFIEKIRLGISYESSARQKTRRKCNVLVSKKNIANIKMSSAAGGISALRHKQSIISKQWRHMYLTFMPSALGKIFSRRQIEMFYLVFPENRFWHLMRLFAWNVKSCFLEKSITKWEWKKLKNRKHQYCNKKYINIFDDIEIFPMVNMFQQAIKYIQYHDEWQYNQTNKIKIFLYVNSLDLNNYTHPGNILCFQHLSAESRFFFFAWRFNQRM